MPIDYAVVRAELLAQREAIDAALRAFDVIFPTRSTTDGAYVTAPPQPAPTRRSSRPGAPDPAPAPAPPSEAPTRPRKVRTTRPASSATAPGPSNIEKSQHWQAQATKALRAGEGDATVRELAARLRLTGDEAPRDLALEAKIAAHLADIQASRRFKVEDIVWARRVDPVAAEAQDLAGASLCLATMNEADPGATRSRPLTTAVDALGASTHG